MSKRDGPRVKRKPVVKPAATLTLGPSDYLRIVLPGAPVTKKNSPVLVERGSGGRPLPVLLPSQPFRNWLQFLTKHPERLGVSLYEPKQRLNVTAPTYSGPAGAVAITLAQPLNCCALIWRARRVGDTLGYLDAIADALQSLAFVSDDQWIETWDGSRKLLDPKNPRVELVLSAILKQEALL